MQTYMRLCLNSSQKAFEINMDPYYYGVFAEIGAGQEVARHFFRAGGAAGTIAKSISAYDMAVSDDIYGKSGRYVSKERIELMLVKEFNQLRRRLEKDRGKRTCFFSFANTVAAKSFQQRGKSHGWLGCIFQGRPEAPPSQVVVHIHMLDKDNLQQQEALGIMGTNLIYSCYQYAKEQDRFIDSLMDNLSLDRVGIDFIEVQGPAFTSRDSRLWSLELVKRGYCEALIFDSRTGKLQPKDVLYGKNILVCRGSFRPPTLVNLDMLETGINNFKKSLANKNKKEFLTLAEISMNELRERGEVDSKDFLARVELLRALGHHVLISNFETYGQLSYLLSRHTKERLAFVVSYYSLKEVFNHEKYKKSAGGIFGGMGALFGHRTRLFVYPALDPQGKILTTKESEVEDDIRPLVDYLENQKLLMNISDFKEDVLSIWSRTVLKMIQSGQEGWEKMVPPLVAKRVKDYCLFDYSS